jgi:hypothetical protein
MRGAVPKGPKPLKSKKRPPVSRAAAIMQQATNLEVGDTADKITRAPKKKR